MAVSWITRTLSPQISQSTGSFDTARDLWLNLQTRFTRGNHFRMSDLLQELHSMKQGEHSLSAFFTDMQIVWDELEFLRPTPSCSCLHACTCELRNSVQHYKDKEHVICFLKGLNDHFQNVQSQILIMNPLPPISEAYSMILQQERGSSIVSDTTALSATTQCRNQGRGRGRNTSKNSMVCTHCNRTNHTIDSCYFKHGFPLGYRSRNSNYSNQVVVAASSDIQRIEHPSKTTPNETSFSISKEDYQYLIGLLHSSRQEPSAAVNTVGKPSSANTNHHVASGVIKTGSAYLEDDWAS